MKVTLVKKIKSDGAACAKCVDIDARLERDGLSHVIDRVVWADERRPDSEGMQLALELGVSRAPFFLVEEHGRRECFDVYLRFKQRLGSRAAEHTRDLAELVDQHPDLGLI